MTFGILDLVILCLSLSFQDKEPIKHTVMCVLHSIVVMYMITNLQ